jgi:hypothetical protein
MAKDSSKKGLPSRTGKRKTKFAKYFANTQARKQRNVLKHNGPAALAAWKDQLFEKRHKEH